MKKLCLILALLVLLLCFSGCGIGKTAGQAALPEEPADTPVPTAKLAPVQAPEDAASPESGSQT